MVALGSEFTYDGKTVDVSYIVGHVMLEKYVKNTPDGMIFHDGFGMYALRNHDLEDEEYLKQTDKYQDYKLLNRLLVEQMPFEELVIRLEANQNQTR